MLGKLGDTPSGLAVGARGARGGALRGHPATAAAAYQAVAVVYENAGDLGKATEAYDVAIDYCEQTGVPTTGGRLLGLPLPRAEAAGRVAAQPRALALAARRPVASTSESARSPRPS